MYSMSENVEVLWHAGRKEDWHLVVQHFLPSKGSQTHSYGLASRSSRANCNVKEWKTSGASTCAKTHHVWTTQPCMSTIHMCLRLTFRNDFSSGGGHSYLEAHDSTRRQAAICYNERCWWRRGGAPSRRERSIMVGACHPESGRWPPSSHNCRHRQSLTWGWACKRGNNSCTVIQCLLYCISVCFAVNCQYCITKIIMVCYEWPAAVSYMWDFIWTIAVVLGSNRVQCYILFKKQCMVI